MQYVTYPMGVQGAAPPPEVAVSPRLCAVLY